MSGGQKKKIQNLILVGTNRVIHTFTHDLFTHDFELRG